MGLKYWIYTEAILATKRILRDGIDYYSLEALYTMGSLPYYVAVLPIVKNRAFQKRVVAKFIVILLSRENRINEFV